MHDVSCNAQYENRSICTKSSLIFNHLDLFVQLVKHIDTNNYRSLLYAAYS